VGCILLAEIAFAVQEAGGQLIVVGAAADVLVNQLNRPYLLHTAPAGVVGRQREFGGVAVDEAKSFEPPEAVDHGN
jgi:hypothetical protein